MAYGLKQVNFEDAHNVYVAANKGRVTLGFDIDAEEIDSNGCKFDGNGTPSFRALSQIPGFVQVRMGDHEYRVEMRVTRADPDYDKTTKPATITLGE